MSIESVIEALRPLRNRYTAEAPLQAAIAELLTAAGVDHQREYKLPGESGRIDFFCRVGDIGLEVKVNGGVQSHLRQLYRYAPFFNHLILVTTCAAAPEPVALMSGVPPAMRCCPLRVINLNLRL